MKKKIFNTNVDLRFKRPKEGPELSLIRSFVENIERIFCAEGLVLEIFEEPYIETAIPDIVIAFWDENLFNCSWGEARNLLEKQDIKILHHMYLTNKTLDTAALRADLGYSERELEKTIERLTQSGLLHENPQGFKSRSRGEIFFVKTIISIEAKIKNWKKAFEQAWLNKSFASESYVLLPKNKISPQITAYAKKIGVGLIGHNYEDSIVSQKPAREEIPSSYLSWLFNENVGRKWYYKNCYQGVG